MAIEVTPAAIQKIAQLKMQRQTPDDWLKVSLRSGGCSGYTFQTEFVPAPDEKDKIFEFDQGVKICVDKKSYVFLVGMIIGYEEGLLKSGLTFEVPQSKRACGCGESVSF